VKRIFRSPLPIWPDGLSSPAHFFIFPRRPSRNPAIVAHFGPSQPTEGNRLPPFIRAAAAAHPAAPPRHAPPMATRSCLGEAEPNHQVAPFLSPIKVTSPRLLFSCFNSKTVEVILHLQPLPLILPVPLAHRPPTYKRTPTPRPHFPALVFPTSSTVSALSAVHAGCRHHVLLPTAAGLRRRLSAPSEPAGRIPGPPSMFPLIASEVSPTGATSSTRSSELVWQHSRESTMDHSRPLVH
jgi:hypothetical protein